MKSDWNEKWLKWKVIEMKSQNWLKWKVIEMKNDWNEKWLKWKMIELRRRAVAHCAKTHRKNKQTNLN